MTRIIAGFAGSLRLAVPPTGTRPTSDRVREAIFSALDARDAVVGARVLDLYAGSGALGLEAASRGAASVTLVERSSAAHRSIRDNADRVRRAAPVGALPHIVTSTHTVQSFLASAGAAWDIVFLDPPYELDGEELARDLDLLVPRLSEDAMVVVERSKRTPPPTLPPGLTLDRRKDYGDTALYWLTPTPTHD